MSADYAVIPSLSDLMSEVPTESIVSRTFYQDDQIKAILFGFAPGQELSEHTASQPAIIHVLQGEAHLTLGNDEMEAQAGTWVHMAAKLPHSLIARTKVVMLLLLVKGDL